MEIYFLDKPKFQLLYNCSFYNVSDVPLAERTHVFWGYFFLAGYIFFMALYIPCLWAICTSELRKGTTYKLMIQLGIIQIIGLQFAGLYIGLETIWGVVFCSAPVFQYISGCLACQHWFLTTVMCDILGINRLCALYSSDLTHKLFDGKKLYIWMLAPIVYSSLMSWYAPPLIYNSIWMAFFGRNDTSGSYTNPLFAFHNTTICISETVIYILMPILYYRASRFASNELRAKMRHEKKIYFQVIFIGLMNFLISIVYLSMQYIPVSFAAILTATIGYLLSQGMASIGYLVINRTIRRTILKKFGLKLNHISQCSSTLHQQQLGNRAPSLDNNVH